MRFSGRVAMVTGGARGIGEASSKLLAQGGAGVAIVDLDQGVAEETAAAIRAEGGRAIGVGCDVANKAQVQAAVAKTAAEFGRLDILVACAGITRDNMFFRMDEDEWDSVIDTHLKGSFLCAQAAQAEMVKNQYGRIIFLSSRSALGNRGQANYSAAKAGLQGLARTLSIELGKFSVTVNAIAPGFIETRMTQGIAERTGQDWEAVRKAAADRAAVKRTGVPFDIANAVAFLADEATSFVTGQTIYVTGSPTGNT